MFTSDICKQSIYILKFELRSANWKTELNKETSLNIVVTWYSVTINSESTASPGWQHFNVRDRSREIFYESFFFLFLWLL